MMRFLNGGKWIVVAAALMVLLASTPSLLLAARLGSRLVPQNEVNRVGLHRAWYAQVQLDPARNQVVRWQLVGDDLIVVTSIGVVQSLNALTGETRWTAPIGNPRYPSLGPAANERFVALINGSTLYVLDRRNGRPELTRQVGGGPGAGPALSETYAFVPLISGRIEGYPLGEVVHTPWYYQSYGRAMVPPLATSTLLVWTTDSGHMYIATSDEPAVRHRLEASSEFVAQPAYRRPIIYGATVAGELFAIHESTGNRIWKYASGFPIIRSPAVVGERVFVTSELPAIHAVVAATGNELWEARDITKFAAASQQRVYGIDEIGALVVLDAATGARLGRMTTDHNLDAIVNDQTDRLYLISPDGLVQCLHEIGATEPLYHQPPEEQQPPVDGEPAPDQPADDDPGLGPPAGRQPQPPPADDENPFGGGADVDDRQPSDSSPFGVDDDNPFGAFE